MQTITDKRLLSFIEEIKLTETSDIVDRFMEEVERCNDHADANLAAMLANAQANTPKTAKRESNEGSSRNSILHRCNS